MLIWLVEEWNGTLMFRGSRHIVSFSGREIDLNDSEQTDRSNYIQRYNTARLVHSSSEIAVGDAQL